MTRAGEKLVFYEATSFPVYNESLRVHLRQFCEKLDDRLEGITCCGETLVDKVNQCILG